MGRTLADIERGLQKAQHVLTMANGMEYAPHLHFRDGYYVLDGDHTAELFRKTIRKATEGGVPISDKMIENVLEATGSEEVSHQRDLTGEMRPAVRSGEGERQAHPGHWADISGNLSNAYKAYVNDDLKVPQL